MGEMGPGGNSSPFLQLAAPGPARSWCVCRGDNPRAPRRAPKFDRGAARTIAGPPARPPFVRPSVSQSVRVRLSAGKACSPARPRPPRPRLRGESGRAGPGRGAGGDRPRPAASPAAYRRARRRGGAQGPRAAAPGMAGPEGKFGGGGGSFLLGSRSASASLRLRLAATRRAARAPPRAGQPGKRPEDPAPRREVSSGGGGGG